MLKNRFLLLLVAVFALTIAGAAVAQTITSAQKRNLNQSLPGNVAAVEAITDTVGFGPFTLTTNFNGIAANDCKLSAAITATGVVDGDHCKLGAPAANQALDIVFDCYASGTNEGKIKLCNQTASDITNIASGTYTLKFEDR